MATLLPRLSLVFTAWFSLFAHAISVSTSDGKLEAQTLSLVVKIPRYEAEHLIKAEGEAASKVAAAIRIGGASVTAQACSVVQEDLRCDLSYAFSTPPAEKIEVEVQLARITVPNHVHILRLSRARVERQLVFDRTFERDSIDFHEATQAERWGRSFRLGATQMIFQFVLLLLVLTVALAQGALAYGIAATAAFFAVLPDKFYSAPGFFELAAALSIAYLALERRYFPEAKGLWIAMALIGVIEGAGLAILARPMHATAVAFGLGNLGVQFVLLTAGMLLRRKLPAAHQPFLWLLLGIFGTLQAAWIYWQRF